MSLGRLVQKPVTPTGQAVSPAFLSNHLPGSHIAQQYISEIKALLTRKALGNETAFEPISVVA
ncbi:MAG TPA: hypothetical protein VNX46_16045 [Candidatus Acidoferrum sp.]|nr:hypothetical protein [Candidatus Acidoferrum sp.]